MQIPNIYLGLGFEFGPQRIRNLAIVCPQSVDKCMTLISFPYSLFSLFSRKKRLLMRTLLTESFKCISIFYQHWIEILFEVVLLFLPIKIFLIFFFIQKYQFSGTFFIIEIFDSFNFWNTLFSKMMHTFWLLWKSAKVK